MKRFCQKSVVPFKFECLRDSTTVVVHTDVCNFTFSSGSASYNFQPALLHAVRVLNLFYYIQEEDFE